MVPWPLGYGPSAAFWCRWSVRRNDPCLNHTFGPATLHTKTNIYFWHYSCVSPRHINPLSSTWNMWPLASRILNFNYYQLALQILKIRDRHAPQPPRNRHHCPCYHPHGHVETATSCRFYCAIHFYVDPSSSSIWIYQTLQCTPRSFSLSRNRCHCYGAWRYV